MKTSKDAKNRLTTRTISWFVILAIVSLFFGSFPSQGFGQALAGFEPLAVAPEAADSAPPPTLSDPAPIVADSAATLSTAVAAPPAAAFPIPPPPPTVPENFSPVNTTAAASSNPVALVATQTPTLPFTPVSAKSPTATNREPTAKQLQERPELLRSVAAADHPFYDYFKAPNDPKSPIQGKPYSVAELLNGVREPSARRQLLITYWELTGLLAEWNMRFDSERRAEMWYTEASNARNTQRIDGFVGAVLLTRQQRKATEIAFARKQYQLVEQLRSLRGVSFAAKDYPIPNDYPIAKNYVTYVDKIARSERARYIGRLIPFQAELVEVRKQSRQAADGYFLATTQNPQTSPQDCVAALNQRTDAFAALVTSVVDYNKTIAEYTAETVGSNVGNYRLLGAILELPKVDATTQPPQLASPPSNPISRLEEPRPPLALATGESAYSRPLSDTVDSGGDAPPLNPFAEGGPQPAPLVAEVVPAPSSKPFPEVTPAVLTADSTPPAEVSHPVQPASYVEKK